MEDGSFVAMVLLLALCSFIFISSIKPRPTNPKQPFCLPVIGHYYLLWGYKLPHRRFMDLSKKYGPVMLLRFGSVPTLIVSSPDGAREFLRTHDAIFCNRPPLFLQDYMTYNGQDIVTSPYNDSWKMLRRLCLTELFSNRRLASFRNLRAHELGGLLRLLHDKACQQEPVQLRSLISDMSFNIVTMMVLSKRYGQDDAHENEAQEFRQLMNNINRIVGSFFIGEYVSYLKWIDWMVNGADFKKLKGSQDAFWDKILEERRKENREQKGARSRDDDFLDVFLSQPGIRDEQIKATMMNLLLGGTDSSLSVVEWAMAELLANKQAMDKVQAELDAIVGPNKLVEEPDLQRLDYLNAVIKETLRLHPPAPMLVPHESIESCKVDEIFIPAKTRLTINAFAIGRDRKVWGEDVEEFKPERFEGSEITVWGKHFELIPFGAGRRACPAISMGMLTIQIVLATLLHCFNWSLPTHGLELEEAFGTPMQPARPLQSIPSTRFSPCLFFP